MSVSPTEEQLRCQVLLNELLKQGGNKRCAECFNPGPNWVSTNLGVFLCLSCAGIHRSLGSEISRIKSIGLDNWTMEEVTRLQSMGNSLARIMYEANLPPDFERPKSYSEMTGFIHQKYLARKYTNPFGSPHHKHHFKFAEIIQPKRHVKDKKPSVLFDFEHPTVVSPAKVLEDLHTEKPMDSLSKVEPFSVKELLEAFDPLLRKDNDDTDAIHRTFDFDDMWEGKKPVQLQRDSILALYGPSSGQWWMNSRRNGDCFFPTGLTRHIGVSPATNASAMRIYNRPPPTHFSYVPARYADEEDLDNFADFDKHMFKSS